MAVRRAIGHLRARQWRTAGALWWQLNDSWPVVSWSLVDYCGRPKPAWHEIRRMFQPVIVTIQPVIPADATIEMLLDDNAWRELEWAAWIVNDTRAPWSGQLRWRDDSRSVTVPAQSSARVASLGRLTAGEIPVAEIPGSRDIAWLAHRPRDLRLPAHPLRWEVAGNEVQITATALALAVEGDAGTAEPADNFFDMLPGETRTIVLKGEVGAVTVRSLEEIFVK